MNMTLNSNDLTLYKLIILYMLNKVEFPLSNAQISDFILNKDYTDYFHIQQALKELSDASFLTTETRRNSSFLRITDAGREVLEFCKNEISESIKNEINDYLKLHNCQLREEASNIATYYQSAKPNEYIAHCLVKEGDSNLIELNLAVSSVKEAEVICSHWKEKSQDIYAYIIRALMANNV